MRTVESDRGAALGQLEFPLEILLRDLDMAQHGCGEGVAHLRGTM